jgi:cyclopropane fatty-acyl-phospholipid synthase-like methyltransferase
MKTKLTEQNYWVDVQGNINLNLPKNHIIKRWIESHLDFKQVKSCIEIGCFPGRYLTIFADHDIEVNGLDFIPNVESLKAVFEENGYKAGEFINADFTMYLPKRKYDCVASFGLIEHFTNWDEVFKKHFDYVDVDGFLIIETPNFRGFFQRVPRFLFDYKNYKRHNIKAMNLQAWKKLLLENDFEIINASYFGGYELWDESNIKNRYFLKLKYYIQTLFFKMQKLLYQKTKENKSFSCYLGIIARRNPSQKN